MAYCTQTDVTNRWSATKWWSDADADGTIDASIVTAAIATADGEIDSWVAQQYAVPLTLGNANTARMIAAKSTFLAGYVLAGRVNDRDARDVMADEYKSVMEWLRLVAKGDVKLADETATATESVSGRTVYGGDAAVFTRDEMDGL